MQVKNYHNNLNADEAIFVDEQSILDYLHSQRYNRGHGSDSKDYEKVSAVWIKRLFEKRDNLSYCVAFPLKGNLYELIPNFNCHNLGHLQEAFEKWQLEDTLIDFAIVRGTAGKNEGAGLGFQVKRFGKGIKTHFIDKLINFIIEKTKVDAKDEGLIIIPEIDDILDKEEQETLEQKIPLKKVNEKIILNKISYEMILILSGRPDNLHLTEIYPSIKQIFP